LTLEEEHRLRAFENWILRSIFGPKESEVLVAGRRKLHNEEHHSNDSSPNITRMMKSRGIILAGHVAHMEKRNAYSNSDIKPDGKEPLGRS
jgi:hypothetical protein